MNALLTAARFRNGPQGTRRLPQAGATGLERYQNGYTTLATTGPHQIVVLGPEITGALVRWASVETAHFGSIRHHERMPFARSGASIRPTMSVQPAEIQVDIDARAYDASLLTFISREPGSHSLSRIVDEAFARATLKVDAYGDAALARADGMAFSAANASLAGTPAVAMSRHGVLSMHWGSRVEGVLIVFVGDGTASSAIKQPGGHYAMSDIESPAGERLPAEVAEAISRLC